MKPYIKQGETDEIQLRQIGSYLIAKKDWYMKPGEEMKVELTFTPGKNNDWVTITYLHDLTLQPRDNGPSQSLKPNQW